MNKNTNIENEEEDLTGQAPLLFNRKNINPFEVPNHYFEGFPSAIQLRVSSTKQKFPIAEWLSLLIKPRFAVPFLTVVFLVVVGINFTNKNADVPKTGMAEEMTTEEQLSTIDEGTILETLYAKEFEESENIASSDEGAIQNYLMENNIEESNFNNKL